MNTKKWSIMLLTVILISLVVLGGITAVIDPFFHYHAPLPFLQYHMDTISQRYLNDGIVKHFTYDSIITGDSMTENFKASEFDALFDACSVKVCFSGSTLTELSRNLRQAISANPHIKQIFCDINSWHMVEDQDAMLTDMEIPDYLYDKNLANDVQYLLNKEVLVNYTIRTVGDTLQGETMTNFDEYSSWDAPTGMDAVLLNTPRIPTPSETVSPLTQEDRQRITDNLTKKLISLARDNPDIQFIFFFPPYSILRWDAFNRSGTMSAELDTWRLACDLLLDVENIQLYAFYTDYETITNLANYRDDVHYSANVNSQILQKIARGEGLLTKENYRAYWQEVENFYSSYDYDALFQEVTPSEK